VSDPSRVRTLVDFARPVHAHRPGAGFASAAATAIGASPHERGAGTVVPPAIGSVHARVLNIASKRADQIFDFEIDR